MSINRKRWTPEEIEILEKAVTDCTGNLQMAFRATSEIIGRSPQACELYWYKKLSKKSRVFWVFSKKVYGTNRKNCNTKVVKNPSKFERIIKSIIKILKDED